jgi:hypothetical protein
MGLSFGKHDFIPGLSYWLGWKKEAMTENDEKFLHELKFSELVFKTYV